LDDWLLTDKARSDAADNEGEGGREQTPASATYRRLEVVRPPSGGFYAEPKISAGHRGLACMKVAARRIMRHGGFL
jgi:hypothetical protein